MSANKKIKLSKAQVKVIIKCKSEGSCYFANCQNKTAQKLILLGICDWDGKFENLVLTPFGKTIEL